MKISCAVNGKRYLDCGPVIEELSRGRSEITTKMIGDAQRMFFQKSRPKKSGLGSVFSGASVGVLLGSQCRGLGGHEGPWGLPGLGGLSTFGLR